jgi:glycosyltransferase involved in cell wall biosynthesis
MGELGGHSPRPASPRAAGPPRIAIVNTSDAGGGVEQTSMTLLDHMLELGVDAWMVVGARHGDHPRVVSMYASPYVDYRPYQPQLRRRLSRARWEIDRRVGREDFEHPLTGELLGMAGAPPDVVLCQNLHGGYFDLRMLPRLSRRAPLVLSLNDSWLFTGHCACPLTCGRWATGCGRCPALEIPPAIRRDATAANWRRKRELLARSRLWAIAPSRWLLARARRSLLADSLTNARVVALGVDLASFSPGSRERARATLGIDPDRSVALYVANLGAANRTKDFSAVRRALGRLAERRGADPAGTGAALELVVVGAERTPEDLGAGVRIRHLPYCASPGTLAELYRACDVYVHSAPEESFSLTTAEAMACGAPVLAAAGGGIRELFEHERDGLLLEPGDDAALADALGALLGDRERARRIGAAAALTAARRFDAARMASETLAWCGEVVERWRAGEGAGAASAMPGGG